MKRCKTEKYRKRHKKEMANRKAKVLAAAPPQPPNNQPISAARKAFEGL